jgi:hypothetical protein
MIEKAFELNADGVAFPEEGSVLAGEGEIFRHNRSI